MKRSWYELKAKAGGKSATLDIMDEIGLWGVTAAELAADLKALGEGLETITVRVNSPGGSVWDAIAIHTMLSTMSARVVVEVIGVAASAASYIITAADEVRIARDAFVMIHFPRMSTSGVSDELRHAADFLDKVASNMVDAYAGRMKKDADEVRALLAVETWYSAEEAVAAGLADKVFSGPKVTANFDVRRHVRTLPAGYNRPPTMENTSMDVKLEELSEEDRKKLEDEVRAKLEAEAKAKADADAEAAAKAKKDGENGGTAPTANANAEALQIMDACAIAGKPEAAADYIRNGKNLSDVMADLRKNVVQSGGTNLNTRRPSTPAANEGDLSALDVGAIYDKANGIKK